MFLFETGKLLTAQLSHLKKGSDLSKIANMSHRRNRYLATVVPRYLDKEVRTLDVSGKLIKEVVVEAIKAAHTLSQVPKKGTNRRMLQKEETSAADASERLNTYCACVVQNKDLLRMRRKEKTLTANCAIGACVGI